MRNRVLVIHKGRAHAPIPRELRLWLAERRIERGAA